MRTERISLLSLREMSMRGRASILLVAITALVMLALLYRTESNAARIKGEAATIAQSGRGINSYTDSLVLLNRTNAYAESILASVQPLSEQLSAINSQTAKINTSVGSIHGSSVSIDSSAGSIDTSSRSINGSVGQIANEVLSINGSLRGINQNAAEILQTAAELRIGVTTISSNLSSTVRVISQILAQTQNIRNGVTRTNHLAACIDNGLNGGPKC